MEEDLRIRNDTNPVNPDSINYTIIGTKTTYTVKKGETLTRVSLRFYGTKDLWPYIQKYNHTKIKNPGMITPGMILTIPELKKKDP
jgi:nucleoid-associated protein YgaU